MKLWSKSGNINQQIESFTVGMDRELDLLLAQHDVIGSIAHVHMLKHVGLMDDSEETMLIKGLKAVLVTIENGGFSIKDGIEDVHSQVEMILTEKIGEVGKKLHTARSRNDQVLLDLRLFFRSTIQEVHELVVPLIQTFLSQADQFKNYFIPGYTHMQVAMPSSFGLWYGAYAEALIDDLNLMEDVYDLLNQNPLGSAAGYGSSFPIDRQKTTDLLGFKSLCVNSIFAQMGRGKSEWHFANMIASIAMTLNKFAMDVTLYSSQNFAFLTLPDAFTTGSSIMPHKKNPDVFELIRAKCGKLMGLPNQVQLMIHNLPSGYHRDFQVLKEIIFPAIVELKDCLSITSECLPQIKHEENILDEEKYDLAFTVETVNALVQSGMPFRDAYHEVARLVKNDTFSPNKNLNHSHIGSIGHLGLDLIEEKLEANRLGKKMEKVRGKIDALVGG